MYESIFYPKRLCGVVWFYNASLKHFISFLKAKRKPCYRERCLQQEALASYFSLQSAQNLFAAASDKSIQCQGLDCEKPRKEALITIFLKLCWGKEQIFKDAGIETVAKTSSSVSARNLSPPKERVLLSSCHLQAQFCAKKVWGCFFYSFSPGLSLMSEQNPR